MNLQGVVFLANLGHTKLPIKEKPNSVTEVEVEVDVALEVKHPLEYTWCFWMYTNKKRNWEANLVNMTDFSTVEDYWCLYYYMKAPSELLLGQDYAIFKKGVRPMWEDSANKSGGRWIIRGLSKLEMDRIWLDTVLLVIGESVPNTDAISGVVANVRGENKISIWTGTTDEKINMEIGIMLKEALGYQRQIKYQVHKISAYLYCIK